MAMSAEHKAALVQGRKEAKAIKAYLEALAARKPGRPVTRDSMERKLASIDARLKEERDPLRRVDLHQSRIEAEGSLTSLSDTSDIDSLEKEFTEVARTYSERKGISYAAWRGAGVPASTLKRAGIARTRRG
jgi:hypothetical protein